MWLYSNGLARIKSRTLGKSTTSQLSHHIDETLAQVSHARVRMTCPGDRDIRRGQKAPTHCLGETVGEPMGGLNHCDTCRLNSLVRA
eukprot:m.296429 g.296429  ORF g.296429 m.296429 type:complete len:87 (+) comp16274_c0_seq2:1295-1555(+)